MECCTTTCLLVTFVVYVLYALLSRLLRIPSVGRYNERYILVTGCDTGFGHEIAKRLDRLGCHVFAGCLTEKGETELKKTSQRLHTISLDVSSDKSVRAAFKYVTEKLPPGNGLWGVLNNAGIPGKSGRMEWLTADDYKQVAAVNLYGMIDLTMTFLPLIKKERGRIVNTSSVAGRAAFQHFIPYCVSKYGVEAFSDGLRRSLRPYGVKVCIIEPGYHSTNMTSSASHYHSWQQAWNQATPEVKKEFGEEYFQTMVQETDVPPTMSVGVYPVVDAYEHALLGRYPQPRYVVGYDARYIDLTIQSLPERFGDWIHEKRNPSVLPAHLKK